MQPPVLHQTSASWHCVFLQLSTFQSAMFPDVVIKGDHWMNTPMTSYDEPIPPCFKRHIFNVCTHPLWMQQLYLTAFLLHFYCIFVSPWALLYDCIMPSILYIIVWTGCLLYAFFALIDLILLYHHLLYKIWTATMRCLVKFHAVPWDRNEPL